MAIQVKRGHILKPAAEGSQAYSGIGFQPSVIILLSTALTALGGDVHIRHSMGAAKSSSARWCMGWAHDDAAASSNTQVRMNSTKCITIPADANGTTYFEADLVSMDADGFTLNWSGAPSVNWTNVACMVEYIAIGGVSSAVGARAVGTVLGNASVTGFGFQPKAMIVCSGGLTGAAPNNNTTAPVSVGVAASASQRGHTAYRGADNSAADDILTYQRATLLGSLTAAALDWEVDLVSFDADGFTYNLIDSGNSDLMFYVAIGGGTFEASVSDLAQPTSAGQQAVSGLGFQPKLLFGISGQEQTAHDAQGAFSSTRNARQVIGVRDPSSEACLWLSAIDAADPMDVDRNYSQSKFLTFLDNTRAVLAECDSLIGTDGFTLDWTTADATARKLFVLAVGEDPPPPPAQGNQKLSMLL